MNYEKEKDDERSSKAESGTLNLDTESSKDLTLEQIVDYEKKESLQGKDYSAEEKDEVDIIEEEAKLFLENHFPNYTKFWKLYVVPRTNRPENIRIKKDTPYIERVIMMLHYSILRNLVFVKRGMNNLVDNRIFENSYIRLSSATDVCEEFLFWFIIWVKNETIDNIVKKNPKFLKKCAIEKENAIKRLNNGINYSIPILSKKEILKDLTNKDFGKEFFVCINEIRQYRNILVHSWPTFRINNLYPKREFVKEFRDWVEIESALEDEKTRQNVIETKFKKMNEILSSDFDKFVQLVNVLWESILKMLENKK